MTIRRRVLLGLGCIVIVVIVGAAYFHFAAEVRPSARYYDFRASSSQSQVSLRIETFEVPARRLAGTAQVSLRSTAFPQETWDTIQSMGKIHLFLMHSTEPNHFQAVGGTAAQVELVELPDLALTGDESFWWNVDTIIPEFFYPFDRYRVVVNPRLGVRNDGMSLYSVGHLDLDMLVPGLYMTISQLNGTDPSADTHEIILERSVFFRGTTVLVGIMALSMVLFYWFRAKIDQLVWQPLALFAALWAIRGILRGDVSSSSFILVDWVTILIYGLLVIIIFVRWQQIQRQQEAAITHCPYCDTEIKKTATRCPACTSLIDRVKPASTRSG